jgi:fumarate reductase flavoprotein subunit
MQRAAGIADSPQAFAEDIQAKARGTAAAHLAAAYAAASGPAVDWLAERHGLPFELLHGFLYPGHRLQRMHAMPERTGQALHARLEAAARAAGVDIVTDARVVELVVDAAAEGPRSGGRPAAARPARPRLLGLRYRRPDGRIEAVGCEALVLACNGFGGNPALVARHLPEMRDAAFAGHTGNDGSAILWGEQLGARLADLNGYQGHGSWAVPHGLLISWALMVEGAVQVNACGARFHDETRGYSEAAVDVLAQPGGVAWDVFDGPLLELARTFPDFLDAQAAGAVRPAADPDALARLVGCEVAALNGTLAQVAACARARAPDEHGRHFTRALQAPFFAVKVTGALFHTQGGLDVDASCRVLGRDGAPLPNLLAAGGAARGVSGNAVWGYLSGNGLLSAIAGGWIAGATAGRLAGRSPGPGAPAATP